MFSTVYAQSWVIYNNETKEIYSLSPEDDCVMPEIGYTKVIIDDDFKDIRLEYSSEYYKWIDGKFVKNLEKLSDDANRQIAIEEEIAEEREVQEYIRSEAIKAMKENGKIFKYLSPKE